MSNYLKKTNELLNEKGMDTKDYSLSNNNISDEPEILSLMIPEKIAELVGRYPDYNYAELTKVLQAKYKIENIIYGSGSEDLIIRINLALKQRGLIGISYPNFYRIMETAGPHEKIFMEYSRDSEFFDVGSIKEQLGDVKGIKSFWITNPNPMIGKIFSKEDMEKLVMDRPDVLFIFDESAIDFVQNGDSYSMLDLSQCVSNLIVIRSFSKLYGLAGLRVGFATGQSGLLDEVRKIGLTFPLSTVAEYFAVNVLANDRLFDKVRGKIEKNKSIVRELLKKDSDIIFSESVTNCLFFSSRKEDIFEKLLSFGIVTLKLDKTEGVNETNIIRMAIHSSDKRFDDLYLSLSKLSK